MTGRLYIRDALRAGYCRDGIREKCRLLGIDYLVLHRIGIPIEQAEQIDDAQIQRAVAVAKAREENG